MGIYSRARAFRIFFRARHLLLSKIDSEGKLNFRVERERRRRDRNLSRKRFSFFFFLMMRFGVTNSVGLYKESLCIIENLI